MEIELLIQDNQIGTIYDASTLAKTITWTGQVAGQAGKLQFDIVRDGTLQFYEGSPVRLKVDGRGFFFGWVVSKTRRDSEITTVTALDQLWYMKNADTYVFEDMTASDIFQNVCADFRLTAKVVHPSGFILPAKVYDGKSIADIVQDAIDLTLVNTREWYMIRDNYGTLEFLDMAKLKTNLILGDASLMTHYNYQTSIEQDTYNQIKLVKDNNDGEKRDVYIAMDSSTIDRWGLLQYYETVDEQANEKQIEERADQLLLLKNRVERKLSLDALGDWRVMPGNGIWVETALDDVVLSRYMIVHKCSHKLENQKHTMSVTLEVIE